MKIQEIINLMREMALARESDKGFMKLNEKYKKGIVEKILELSSTRAKEISIELVLEHHRGSVAELLEKFDAYTAGVLIIKALNESEDIHISDEIMVELSILEDDEEEEQSK